MPIGEIRGDEKVGEKRFSFATDIALASLTNDTGWAVLVRTASPFAERTNAVRKA